MAFRQFEQVVPIDAPVEAIFAFLRNPANHKQLHPLIEKIEIVDEGIDDQKRPFRTFVVTDRLKMVGIRFKLNYTATLTETGPAQIQLTTTQSPSVRVKSVMTLTPDGEASATIHEVYDIEAPGLLMGYVAKQAIPAHEAMLASLKRVMEHNA